MPVEISRHLSSIQTIFTLYDISIIFRTKIMLQLKIPGTILITSEFYGNVVCYIISKIFLKYERRKLRTKTKHQPSP